MTITRDPSTIRLYICAKCTNKNKYQLTKENVRPYRGIHVMPWKCAECGHKEIDLSQPCFSSVPDPQTLKWYISQPDFYHKIWFIDNNYGYFDTQFSNIVEILT
jgi:hypothetical protein